MNGMKIVIGCNDDTEVWNGLVLSGSRWIPHLRLCCKVKSVWICSTIKALDVQSETFLFVGTCSKQYMPSFPQCYNDDTLDVLIGWKVIEDILKRVWKMLYKWKFPFQSLAKWILGKREKDIGNEFSPQFTMFVTTLLIIAFEYSGNTSENSPFYCSDYLIALVHQILCSVYSRRVVTICNKWSSGLQLLQSHLIMAEGFLQQNAERRWIITKYNRCACNEYVRYDRVDSRHDWLLHNGHPWTCVVMPHWFKKIHTQKKHSDEFGVKH